MYLWFPTVKAMAILVVRSEVTAGAAEALARSLIDYGDGQPINDAALGAAFANDSRHNSEGTMKRIVALVALALLLDRVRA